MDDGSSRYVQNRGRIQRESLNSAKDKSCWFTELFQKAVGDKDPHCYTSESGVFTNYSHALEYKKDNEDILICENAEPALFTLAIE